MLSKFAETLGITFHSRHAPRDFNGWMHWKCGGLRIQLLLFKWGSFNVGITLSGIDDYPLHITFCIPLLLRFYLSLNTRWLRRVVEKVAGRTERDIGVRLNDWYLNIALWENTHAWSNTDPWWWHFDVNVQELLIGRLTVRHDTLKEYTVTAHLPEHNYQVHAKHEIATHSWARWPFKRRYERIEYEIADGPIPIPGKGENAWDLEDDGIFGGSLPYAADLDLAAHIKNMVLGYRRERA